MVLTRYGDIIKGYKFTCKRCSAEWYANKREVEKITPSFIKYDIYMNCPCCDERVYSKAVESEVYDASSD